MPKSWVINIKINTNEKNNYVLHRKHRPEEGKFDVIYDGYDITELLMHYISNNSCRYPQKEQIYYHKGKADCFCGREIPDDYKGIEIKGAIHSCCPYYLDDLEVYINGNETNYNNIDKEAFLNKLNKNLTPKKRIR